MPIDYLIPQDWYDNVIAVNPSDPDKVFAAGVRCLFSTDGGQTWTYIPEKYYNAGIVHSDHHAAAYNPQHPDTLYDGSDGGFYRATQNATNWEQRSLGLAISQFYGGAMYPNNDALVFGGTQDNGTLQSNGSELLTETFGGDGGYTAVNQQHPNVIYSENYDLSLEKSTDLGTTWARAINGIPADEETEFYAPYAIDPANGNILYWGSYRIWKTIDGANSWEASGCLFQPSPFEGCYFISTVSVSPYNDSIILAGGDNGEIARSTNAGASWGDINSGMPAVYITSVHAAQNKSLYATADGFNNGHVFWWTDTAKKWKNISGNLPDVPANDVFVTGDTLVVGTQIGVYISTNNGANWEIYGAGMPTVSTDQLVFNPATQTLRAMTHGRSVYDISFGSPAPQAPVFQSLPDTSAISPGLSYVYAPIVTGYPTPTYSIKTSGIGGSNVTVDTLLGVVRWTAQVGGVTITLTATNSVGAASQTFSLAVPVVDPSPNWRVVSTEQTNRKSMQLFATEDHSLWMTQDTAIVARSADAGAIWTRSIFPADSLGPATGVWAFDSMTAFVGTWQGNIYMTSDGGATWRISRSDPNMRYDNLFFWNRTNGMAISGTEKDTLFIITTTNGGTTWQESPSRVFGYYPCPGSLYFIDNVHGWFASSNQQAPSPTTATIFYTTNAGITWTGGASDCNQVRSIGFCDTLTGFAVDQWGGIVDKTTNGGHTWTSINIPPAGHDLCEVKTFPPTGVVWMVSSTYAWISDR